VTTFLTDSIENGICFLTESESRHAIKVLRMNNKDELSIINGNGLYGKGEIIDSNPKKTKIKIHELKEIKKPVPLTLAFCPTKNNDRNKLIIEKATEIGVTDFFPIISQNSERRKWNTERFEKVLISSIKQSQRLWIPTIHPAEKFNDFIKKISYKLKLLAHCKEGEKVQLKKISNSLESQVIVIGPEGDFTSEEIELAKANNYKMISLGNNRLRTETACIAAVTLMKL
jgi:16S rRNA (uracil1498-N3)-methyltransferase